MVIKNYKKHNSVPIKQWSNINYSFNKNNEKSLLSKKDRVKRILSNYFNLTKKVKSFKSKRMRNLIKRFSNIRLFNNEGGIKQNSDKMNITIYTFDKEKSTQLKTLYNINKSLININKYNTNRLKNIDDIININNIKTKSISNISEKKLSLKNLISAFFKNSKEQNREYKSKDFKLTRKNNILFNNIYMKNIYCYNKNRLNVKSNEKKFKTMTIKKILFKKRKIMLQNKRNLFYRKLINTLPWSFKNSKVTLYKIIYLRLFYMYILESLGISLTMQKHQNSLVLTCNNNIYESTSSINENLPNKFLFINNQDKLYELIEKKIKNKLILKYNLNSKIYSLQRGNNYHEIKNFEKRLNIISRDITKRKIPKLINSLKLERTIWLNNKLEKITNIALNVFNTKVTNNYINTFSSTNKLINTLYKEFKINNTNILFKYFFDKQLTIIRNINKLFTNNDKYTNFTNNLKYGLNKLYNKKVYLNLVDLKYLHLNANNFIDAIIIKLKNRNNSLLRIIRRSMKLAKLTKFTNTTSSQDNNNNVKLFSLINEMYNISPTKISEINSLAKEDSTIETIKPNVKQGINWEKNNKVFKNKTKEIFKNLKHKWISGVKLEAKGRLTKRFTSSRALFKYKTKGNLRTKSEISNENFLNLIKKGNKVYKKSPSVILSRGINIPSIQYVKKSGVRRIGSFGIKLWINNN